MKKQSRTVGRRGRSDSRQQSHLPLVDILVDTQAELQELVVSSRDTVAVPGCSRTVESLSRSGE